MCYIGNPPPSDVVKIVVSYDIPIHLFQIQFHPKTQTPLPQPSLPPALCGIPAGGDRIACSDDLPLLSTEKGGCRARSSSEDDCLLDSSIRMNYGLGLGPRAVCKHVEVLCSGHAVSQIPILRAMPFTIRNKQESSPGDTATCSGPHEPRLSTLRRVPQDVSNSASALNQRGIVLEFKLATTYSVYS